MPFRGQYLYAGNETVIRTSQIVGIFDLDTSTSNADTRKFLASREKNGKVSAVIDELPKAFILLRDGRVIMTQAASSTLIARAVEK